MRLRHILHTSIITWIPLAAAIVLMSGLAYVLVQQDQRSAANDPQIQMAIDARNALDGGAPAQSLVPATPIDIAQSQTPYLVIYDADGHILAASATLHGLALIPPAGVFASARTLPMDAITWTPDRAEPSVRSAIVVIRSSSGYVLAGRSLTQVEKNEDNSLKLAFWGCLAALMLTLAVMVLSQALAARLSRARE